MNSLNFYKYLALITGGSIILGLLFVFLFSKSNNQSTLQNNPGPLPNKSYTYFSQQDIDRRNQYEKVTALLDKLPYQGKYFKLEYSYSGNVFILTENNSQEVLGDNEFRIFLQNNQILSQEWLQNLQKVVK